MNPIGGILTAILCAFIFSLPRSRAAVALIAGVCYITEGQDLNLGFHFTAIRLILLAGFLRVLSKGEFARIRFNSIDRTFVAYVLCEAFIATIRGASAEALVYELGAIYNRGLSYIVLRSLINNWDDLRETLASAAIAIIPLVLLMALEARTNHNLFAIFGGVFDSSMVRDGQVRAQGPFRSPITAGSFGAILGMLFSSVLFADGNQRRKRFIIGLIGSIVIVLSAHSSGPLLGFTLGVGSLVMWRFRRFMRLVRWGIVFSIIVLHIVMKAPVWFILARLSDVVGGGGFHRAELIDIFFKNFGNWWLAGMDAIETAQWFPYALSEQGGGGADITNQFVADGIRAGLIGLFLSILLFVRCFQAVGQSIRQNQEHDQTKQRIAWALGATLVCSVGIQFSVTYFDQMYVLGLGFLACISSITNETSVFDGPHQFLPNEKPISL